MDNVTTQHLDEIVISLENTAKDKGFVTYDDINNALSMSRVTPEDIEYILAALGSKNIETRKSDDVKIELAPHYARRPDSGLTRYVWVRLCDTFLNGGTD